MKVHFYLRFHTHYGQQLRIAGNLKGLTQQDGKALTMTFLNDNYWFATIETDPSQEPVARYAYQLEMPDGTIVQEWGNDRVIDLGANDVLELQVVDTWNHAGEYENAFFTAPFTETLFPKPDPKKIKQPKNYTHCFRVKAPLLHKNEVLCLAGNIPALGEWSTDNPVQMHLEENWWTVRLELPKEGFPLQYKYGIYHTKSKAFRQFEAGENRILFGDAHQNERMIVHDGFAHLPNTSWKGAGVAIPVFSLRSKESFGVGEFTDLLQLVDWAEEVGMKLIQLLPVNDTSATNSWTDSYPYAAISAFALHPIYVNLNEVAGKKNHGLIKALKKEQKELNDLPEVDYERVLNIKLKVMRELFLLDKDHTLGSDDFTAFFDKNRHWLVPYAAFCCLRDKQGTTDFTQWNIYSQYNEAAIAEFVSPGEEHFDQVAFHYYLQYHLHLQLRAATAYAHKRGIIVKGDIPIGIYRYSCDAWMAPELYNMDQQAGAPPDDFAIKGQNWGFPTYNWQKMQEDGFTWWKQRFSQMSEYFDAFRIDHILGFFRIWSIPWTAVEGIMGHFVPALPVYAQEFQDRGIWFDFHRYTKPYITEAVLWSKFGAMADRIKQTFLESTGYGQFDFKPAFDNQRKVEQWFNLQPSHEENEQIRQGLYDLHSNVILFEVPGSNGTQFHFRFGIDRTFSFQHLEEGTKEGLKELYVHYFFRRQDDFWQQEALHKLPALKASTNMLICGEDLGMVPACVPDVMKQLGILSLEIQRMPKNPREEFFHPNDAPYLSVVTPSTHDMSTIRGWWEEDREKTQRFFNTQLGQWGEAPIFCEPWINKAIVIQHLYSPAMWSIFQIQDLLGIDGKIRRNNPEDERINIPSIAKHYWRYRMHLSLEALQKEKSFNHELKEYIRSSGRS